MPPAAIIAAELPEDRDALELAVAAALDALGRRAGSQRLVHAATILRGTAGGRPEIDDAAALAEMRRIREHDRALSVRQAAVKVARTVADRADIDATAERLRRKYRAG